MRISFITIVGVLSLSFVATSASAQSSDPYFATANANYDLIYHETGDTSVAGAHFDFAGTVKRDVPFLGIVGEIGVNHFEGATVSSYMGGARLRIPNLTPSILPFAQFVVGLYHCGACNINDFAIQGGAGLDFKVTRSDVIRVRTQLDIRHVFDDVQGFTPVRVSAGIVFPLNR
jgi:hypothetical protein